MGKQLKQTKNSFKAIGKVANLNKPYAVYRGVVGAGKKNEGKAIQSVKFGVKTNEANTVIVQLMGIEPEQVFLWNSEQAKQLRAKGKKYNGNRVAFEDWLENEEEYKNEGYAVLETRIGLQKDENGKTISRGLPSFVAVDEIIENLHEGDSVMVEGEISYSYYTDKNNRTSLNKNYNIKRLFIINEVDFESPSFEETAFFEQNVVIVETEHDQNEKRTMVTGRHINYNGSYIDVNFVVDYNDGDPAIEKLANALANKVNEGDTITLLGEILNKKVIKTDVDVEEVEEDEDDITAIFGGKSRPKNMERNVLQSFVSEMRIFGVDDWNEGVYDMEEDFEKQAVTQHPQPKNSMSEFGGRASKPMDINPDDLPF